MIKGSVNCGEGEGGGPQSLWDDWEGSLGISPPSPGAINSQLPLPKHTLILLPQATS